MKKSEFIKLVMQCGLKKNEKMLLIDAFDDLNEVEKLNVEKLIRDEVKAEKAISEELLRKKDVIAKNGIGLINKIKRDYLNSDLKLRSNKEHLESEEQSEMILEQLKDKKIKIINKIILVLGLGLIIIYIYLATR